jgi:predicted aminopeptidase
VKRFLPLFLPPLLGACYLVKQAEGQLHILLTQRPLEDVLADPDVPASRKEKIRLVRDVKEFGEREIGLSVSSNYTRFYDTGGRPVSWLVSASAKHRFENHTWWFPVVGTVPYKGFFRRADAVAEARALEADGYDVQLTPVAAYSTLGYFADPVLSTMAEYPDEELAALILHELTHGTVYLAGDTNFNEKLASFVGWQGALEFARRRHGIESEAYARTVEALAREEERARRSRELFEKLDQFYRSDLPRAEKIRRRDEIAGRKVNNAALLMQRRYTDYSLFGEAFEAVGGDWGKFFDLVRKGLPKP